VKPANRADALWAQLVDEAGEEEIERAAAAAVEEAGRDLAAAGFNVEAKRAVARAHVAALMSPRSPGRAASVLYRRPEASRRKRREARRTPGPPGTRVLPETRSGCVRVNLLVPVRVSHHVLVSPERARARARPSVLE
jgi:hypothetical protein